jgi:putative two-component system response regulator
VQESEAVVLALAQAVELRDRTTSGHCERLALYSVALGMALELTHDELRSLYRGSYLHDLGKVALPDNILFKAGMLTDEEWEAVRLHPAAGESICRRLQSFEPVLPIIRSHHERWDGSGYPDGLSGARIPLLARVLQMADIYDALTSQRPYKPAYQPEKALGIMQEETDRGWRDPELMELFLRLHHRVIAELAEAARDGVSMEQSLSELQRHLC